MLGLYPGRSTASGHSQSICWLAMSFGQVDEHRAGPTRRRHVERLAHDAGMSWASVTSQLCLVTGIVMPTVSHSWNASVPITLSGT